MHLPQPGRTVEVNTLVLAYPNQTWLKEDFQTNWNLNPSTLCLLGAMVEELVSVEIVDAQFYDMTIDEFVDSVAEKNPKYIGISVLSTEYKEVLHIAAASLKERMPDLIIIAGGVHVTIEHLDVMSDQNIDYAVVGDGEYVLRDLIQCLEGEGDLPSMGLVYRDNENLMVQERSVIADLDSLPMPNYELVCMEDYVSTGPRTGPQSPPELPYARLVITRGCPVGCSFCQVEAISGKRVRSPSAKKVVDELILLRDRYGIKSFLIDDDNIVIKKVFFKEVLREIIQRNLGLSFIIGAFAIFKLDDEMLDLMVEAGCVGINVAIESGNQRVMDKIVLKPVNLETVPPLIQKVHDAGLWVIANFIIGFPGESWDEIRETIEFAEKCGADYVKFFIAVPLKGTKMWDMASDTGTILHDEGSGVVDWRFSQIISDEWTSDDISILRAYEWDRINFASPEKLKAMGKLWKVSEVELNALRKKTRDAVTSQVLGTTQAVDEVHGRKNGDTSTADSDQVYGDPKQSSPASPSPAQRWVDPASTRVVISKKTGSDLVSN